jgi:hypothetical protein
LAEVLADQRARTLRDIDDRMARHLANFSTALAGGMPATEAGPRPSQAAAHQATAARPPVAARHSLPTFRPVFSTTPSGIPLIYPPSHNPSFGDPVATSTPAQYFMPPIPTAASQQRANHAAGRGSAIPAPDGSPQAPIVVPSILGRGDAGQ